MNKIIISDPEKNRIVFHFNKASLKDKTIPAWTIKHKGQTYYVNHMSSSIGFNTKETPDNEATQASIQFRGALTIEEDKDNYKIAIIS
jgi:hypothetical protein